MKKIFRSKTFLRYILIGASFLILCCIALYGIIMFSTQQEYHKVQQAITQSRMAAALDDLDTQIDILSGLAADVSTNYHFRKSYWEKGAYYEYELLRELKNYVGRTPLTDNYALIYNESDFVFMSSGFKTAMDIYARDYWNADAQWFRSRIENTFQGVRVDQLNGRHILFFVPVRTEGYSKTNGWAVMLFICDGEALESRVRAISGIEGPLSLSCNGAELFGQDIRAREALLCRSDSFILRTDTQTGIFPHLNPLLFLLMALFTVVMVILFGYVNYRPIRSLADKYVEDATDELAALDDRLASLIDSGNENRRQLMDIYDRSRRALVKSILYGAIDDQTADTLHVLDASFNRDNFAAFALGPIDEGNDYDNLIAMIEDLSDANIAFHAVRASENCCVAVAVTMAEYGMDLDARDLLVSLLSEYSERMDVFQGGNCERAEEIAGSFREACATMDARMDRTGAKKAADEMFAAILSGNAVLAQDAMDEWIVTLLGKQGKRGNDKAAVHDVVVGLLENAERRALRVPEADLTALVRANNTQEFARQMAAVLERWCAERPNADRESAGGRPQSICDYIERHFDNPDLSLDMIAEDFHVSANTVSRAVKQRKGRAFREYLIALRLEKAKRLLLQPNTTVTSVCAAVGYTNLSYFIRSFKDFCGQTPYEYRCNAGASERDD